MSQTSVTQLPAETVKLITSTQIVTSVSTAVKELVENSIDAGAKAIQVRLENYGLDLIEVKDDGTGVSYDNVQRMFLPGYTSKIRRFEDLNQLYSYGFRGEALAALCKVGKVSITTKTALDTLAMTYEIDSTGLPLSSKPSHLNNGTIISVSGLFLNLPVRRLFISSKKKMSDELKKTEQVVQSLSLIHPEVTVSIIHNKCPIWRKNSVKDIRQSFMQVVGLKTVSKMDHINKSGNEMNINLIIPKKNLENVENLFTNSIDNMFIYVNKRPVRSKSFSQVVMEHIFHHYSNSNLNISQKYGTCLVSIEMEPHQIDINLEPNKTKVLLKNEAVIIKLLDEILSEYYGHKDFFCSLAKSAVFEETISDDIPEGQQSSKRVKLDIPANEVGERRTKEFKEKNKDWDLTIINEDSIVNSNSQNLYAVGTSGPLSLCSQINNTNSVLSEKEVSEINTRMSETNVNFVASTISKNSEVRLVDRNDIQSRNLEKPVIREWPIRPKFTPDSQTNEVEKETNEKKVEVVEELAADLERNVEKWSNEMLEGIRNDKESDLNNSKFEEAVGEFDLSMQSISSQMGKKELKAFTKFARIMRPRIVQEFPNIMFTQVASILAERWKGLTPEEVKYYEKLAEVVDDNRRLHQEEKQIEKPKTKEKPKTLKKTKSISELLVEKSKLNRPPRKEFPISASGAVVKELLSQSTWEPEEEFHLIGQLQPSGNWLYKNGNELGHVRHQGLQELITFQKMLGAHSVPKKLLDTPIPISEENLGTLLWNVLISMEVEARPNSSKYVVTSDVVTKNGFSVEIDKNGDVITSASIVEVAACIPHYGIPELKDALTMYQKNEDFGLTSWRPTAVYNYITNEAVRTAQQKTKPPDRSEMEEMMNVYRLCLRHLPPVCPHSREIFVVMWTMPDITTRV